MRSPVPPVARIVLSLGREPLRRHRARIAGTRRMFRWAMRSRTRLQNPIAPGITIPVLRLCRAAGFR